MYIVDQRPHQAQAFFIHYKAVLNFPNVDKYSCLKVWICINELALVNMRTAKIVNASKANLNADNT